MICRELAGTGCGRFEMMPCCGLGYRSQKANAGPLVGTEEAYSMGFVLSLVIFLASTGFLVNAAVAPTPSAAVVPVSTPGSSEGRTTLP